tara:strand:- start:135 stop:845 length:711 start_codon:yes stop_codon:yes gene_type:complete
MPDSALSNWITSRKSQGFSEAQIRQELLGRGYQPNIIDQAFGPSQPTNQDKTVKDQGFVLYNALIILFSLVLPTMYIFSSPIISSLVNPDPLFVFIAISISSGLIGLYTSFLFNKICPESKKLIFASVIFSTLLSITFGIFKFVQDIMKPLVDMMASVASLGLGGMAGVKFSAGPDVTTNFILTLVFLNTPFLLHYFKRTDKDIILLFLYLIPILIYILLPILIRYLVPNVLPPSI